MSLEYAAEAVRSKGRGDDTMLVHMTPGEVKGLQQLAMAYGGSLSTNPETGLPEAGFLKSLLPTLIGAGLTIFSGGAINPLTAGLIVGGVEGVRTGDLGKGLMAGLGAYGGAGLGSAAYAAGNQAGTMAASEAGRQTALQSAATQTPSLATTPLQSSLTTGASSAFSPVATQAAPSALQTAMQAGSSSAASGLATPISAATYAAPTTAMGNLAQAGSGISNILGTSGTAATQEAARNAAMAQLGGGTGLATTAGAALAGPLSQPAPMPEVEEYEYNYDGPYKPTERKVRYPGPERDPTDSSEFQYFDVVNPSPGFEPMASSTPLPENTYGPDAPRFAGIPVEIATDPERMRDYQQNPDLYSFAEGGGAKIAPTSYVAGRDAEFDYGFQPMANVPSTQPVQGQMQTQGVSGLPGYKTQSLADLQAQGKIGRGTGFAGTNLTGQQHQSSIINHFLNHPQIGPQLRADGYYAEGGEVDMHNNGFVVDAHTVSEVGNGSSNAGMERFARIGGQPIMGPGDGTSDSIPANIDGMQPAMVARDEVYMPPDAVAMYGGGSLKVGEKKLYALMEQARKSRKKNGRGQSTGLKQLVA